jgi:hypothetical protein
MFYCLSTQKILSNRLARSLFDSAIGMNSLDIDSIISMLDNLNASRINVDVLNSVDTMLQQFSDYLPCIELNRFEALQTESELVERAKELHLNRMVIAGKSSSAMFNIVRC